MSMSHDVYASVNIRLPALTLKINTKTRSFYHILVSLNESPQFDILNECVMGVMSGLLILRK